MPDKCTIALCTTGYSKPQSLSRLQILGPMHFWGVEMYTFLVGVSGVHASMCIQALKPGPKVVVIVTSKTDPTGLNSNGQ